jgi:hypothetical protein
MPRGQPCNHGLGLEAGPHDVMALRTFMPADSSFMTARWRKGNKAFVPEGDGAQW